MQFWLYPIKDCGKIANKTKTKRPEQCFAAPAGHLVGRRYVDPVQSVVLQATPPFSNEQQWKMRRRKKQLPSKVRYVIHSLPRFCVIAKHLPTVHATLNPFIYWSEKLELLFLPALKMYFLQRMMSANFRSILSTWRRSLVPNCCR